MMTSSEGLLVVFPEPVRLLVFSLDAFLAFSRGDRVFLGKTKSS